jgi:hypothetical protein
MPVSIRDRRLHFLSKPSPSREQNRPRLWRFCKKLVGLCLLIGLGTGVVAYRHVTDETRLRALAKLWIESRTGGEAHVGGVRFSLFEGLRLLDVAIALPADAHFDPHDNHFEARTVCRADTIFLRLCPLSMLTGELAVPETIIVDAELDLLYRASDGRWNFQEMLARRPESESTWMADLWPEVRIRGARVRQQRLDADGRTVGAEHRLWVHARPDAGQPAGYRITLTRSSRERDSAALPPERSEVRVDFERGSVTGNLPALAIRDLMLALPRPAADTLNMLAADGFLRVERFAYDPAGEWAAEVGLHDVTMAVPVCDEDRAAPPDARYLAFNDVAGTVHLDASGAWVDLKGRLRETTVAVKGELTLPEDGTLPERLASLGFDLTGTLVGLPLPRDDDASTEAERRFVHAIPALQVSVEDFDGRGPIDMTIHLTRETGPDGAVQFVEGLLTFRGASARYFRFPYRLSDMTGVVHFRPDGLIELKDVAGRQDHNEVTINGVLGGRIFKGGDLEITGRNIALDEALLFCLSPEEAEAIRKFNADVRAEVHVTMTRPPVPLTEPAKPWESEITIDFLDGTLDMTWFPYPLDNLAGRLEINGGRMVARDLRARHGPTEVAVDGLAESLLEDDARMDLRLKATGVVLDETLGRALPESGRRLFDMLQPGGRAEIQGRLYTPSPGEPLTCDLMAEVTNGSVTLPDTDEALTDGRARLRIEPHRLILSHFDGLFHESQVRLDGVIPLDDSLAELSLQVQSHRLELNDRLRAVLPAAADSVWNSFSPAGAVAVHVRYGPAAVTAPASSTQPADTGEPPYAIVIEPLEASACYEAFALPAEALTGRIEVTRDTVTFEKLAGRAGDGTFQLDGRVVLEGDRSETILAVEARDMVFSETLREALPWRLRRLYNDMQPSGRFDLSLQPLQVAVAPELPPHWSLQGRLDLKGASLDLGTKLSRIDGSIEGRVAMDGQWSSEGRFDLANVVVADRTVTDARATFARPADSTRFVIDELFGRFCEGKVVGRLEIDEDPRGSTYGVSLSAHDLSLNAFFDTETDADQPSVRLEGRATGHLDLVGRFGEQASRRGGGSVSIYQAQMLRVPLLLSMMRVIGGSLDDTAFHDAQVRYTIHGDELIFDEIDLRGRGLSMVGAGRAHTPTRTIDLALLIGSPVRLPRFEVLSEFVEGVARELVEVRVEGSLGEPVIRTQIVGSLRRTLENMTQMRRHQD